MALSNRGRGGASSPSSHVLGLPQQHQAEALQEALHPQTVSQEQQHHAGAGQAVNVDHGALLRQEALGQGVAVHRHRQLGHTETHRDTERRGEVTINSNYTRIHILIFYAHIYTRLHR